ncbi:hypothetical protein JB92DRAFT_2824453 [Gautieria morchelliformis]|nr:hypothetical protein JB92DRAFT_2824453 [Gautieria morchelliformis]
MTDLSRWQDRPYWLRYEEVELFIEILNGISCTCDLHIWYAISPMISSHVARALETPEGLKQSVVASDLCAVHAQHPIEQLVFLDLRDSHWMVFHHDLRTPCQERCTTYNSLSYTSEIMDIMDQWCIHHYLLPESPHTPKPSFHCVSLGIQKDSSTCGFWAVYVAFALTLQLLISEQVLGSLTPCELKEIIGSIYIEYMSHEEGLLSQALAPIFARFNPSNLLNTPQIVALCPQTRARAMGAADRNSPPPPNCDRAFHSLICKALNLKFHIDHKYTITSQKVAQVKDPNGLICETVLNGFLHLMSADVAREMTPAAATFKIFDTLLADRLRDTPIKSEFKPPGRAQKGSTMRKRWVPEYDIFQYETLLLPWHIPKKPHWILLVPTSYLSQTHLRGQVKVATAGAMVIHPDTKALRFRILVRLSQEWVLQQAHAHKLLPEPPSPTVISNPPMFTKSSPAPFPLSVSPPLEAQGVPDISRGSLQLKSPSVQRELSDCPPFVGAWGLWKLPNVLYYPAEVIDVKLNDGMATVQWLEPAYRDFMNMATFDIPFAQCSEAIDPELPHELEAHEFNELAAMFTGTSCKYSAIMTEWQELERDRGPHPNLRNPFEPSYLFFSGHSYLLDDIYKYLIESQCGSSLASLLHQSMVSSSAVNEANLTFGPGCAILSYCAIGYAMGISGEEAFELAAQGLLFRDQSSYKLAWQAIRQRLTLTPIEDAQFVRSHRIPDTSIELPAVQILIGPLRQLHTSAAEAPNTMRGTADRAPTRGGTSSVSSAPRGIPKLLIRKGENGYSVESLPRPGIIVETGDRKIRKRKEVDGSEQVEWGRRLRPRK